LVSEELKDLPFLFCPLWLVLGLEPATSSAESSEVWGRKALSKALTLSS
jgi:hypothetical protein